MFTSDLIRGKKGGKKKEKYQFRGENKFNKTLTQKLTQLD